MNWTEGNLARHSRGRARNELLNRQKQYFAKARNRSLSHNGDVKSSPPSISFFKEEHSRRTRLSEREHRSPSQPARQANPPGSKSHLERLREKMTPSGESMGHEPQDRHSHNLHIQSEKGKRPSSHFFEVLELENSSHPSDRAKRRKLLEKTDWAGLSIQQPINLKFPGQTQASTGRAWSKTDRSKRRPKQSSRTLATIHQAEAKVESKHWPKNGTSRPEVLPIRVQIGSQEINPSVSSRSQITSKKRSLRQVSISSTVTSSQEQDYHTARTRWPSYAPRSRSQDKIQQSTSSARSSQRVSLPLRGNTVNTRRHTNTSHQGEPAHVVYYSSSIIHEPTPRRTGEYSILGLDDSRIAEMFKKTRSEDSDSMIGQVECEQPRDPVQLMDSERWLKYIASSDNSIMPLTRGSSMFRSPRFQPNSIGRGPSDIKDQDDLMNTPELQEDSPQTTEESHHQFHSEDQEIQQEVRPSFARKGADIPRTESSYLSSSPPIIQAKGAEKSAQSQKWNSRTKEEDNSAWMGFVFDDDSEYLEKLTFKEAAHQAAQELKPSERSMSTVHASFSSGDGQEMETVATYGTTAPSFDQDGTDSTSFSAISASNIATHGSESSLEEVDMVMWSPKERDLVGPPMAATTVDSDQPLSKSIISPPMVVSSDPETNEATKSGTDGIETTEEPQEVFRFARPGPFIGKFASSGKPGSSIRPLPIPPPVRENQKRKATRGRRRKRALDGRLDIRGLPDLDGDPIED